MPTPGALTLTYDTQLSRVRISATSLPAAATEAVIERSSNQINWTVVRGGEALVPLAGAIRLDDWEFAADVPNYYRVRAWTGTGREIGPALNLNPYLETDASDWAGNNATVSRSTAQAHEGTASLLIAPNGTSPTGGADAVTRVTVTAGHAYLAALRARTTATVTLAPAVDWYTATTGGSLVSTSLVTGAAIGAGAWTSVSGTLTAPVGAVAAIMRARHSGTPTTSWWADEIGLHALDTGPLLAGSITPVLDSVWLKSVARPFLNRPVTPSSYSEVKRPSRAGVFEVIGRSYPVSVTDVRGSRRWTLQLTSDDPGAAGEVKMLLASGDVLLIQTPSTGLLSSVPSGYVVVGDTTEAPLAPHLPITVIEMPCTEVAPPAPSVTGAVGTCQTVLNAYATCDDVLLAFATCADLLELIGAPGDVIVP